MREPYRLDAAGAQWRLRAKEVAETVIGPAAARTDQLGVFPQQSVSALLDGGFPGLCVPAEFGGSGQTSSAFAAVVEEIATACGSTAMIYVMHVVASKGIEASSQFTDRGAVLREISAGRHLSTLAISETGSRSQFWAPVSQLQQTDGACCVTARKSWVTSAQFADSYVASAQCPGAASPAEVTLYFVRRSSAGVHVDGAFNGLGLRGNDSAPVTFQDLRIPHGDLLTTQGTGGDLMLGTLLPWFVIGSSAMAHGLCRAAVQQTAGHLSATGFQHTGTRLRDLPNLRARLARMSVLTEQSRSLLGSTLEAMQAGDSQTPLMILQTRAAALAAADEVTDLAMKTCGGAAFSRQLSLERVFRDARAGWVMAPTADHVNDFIGRTLTGMPLFD